jgi:hypothetical protein
MFKIELGLLFVIPDLIHKLKFRGGLKLLIKNQMVDGYTWVIQYAKIQKA